MAADVPAPNTVQVTIWYQLDTSGTGQDTRFWQNSLYFERIEGSVTYDNATELGIALSDWWGEEISPRMPLRVQGREIRIYDLTTTKTLVQFHGLFLAEGSVVADPLPLNCGLRIEFFTTLEGRSGRGNNTIAGIPNDSYLLNEVDELWATGIVAAYQLLIPLATDHGWVWVVCSRRADGLDRTSALNTPITDVEFADLHVDSWRGRLNHRGF